MATRGARVVRGLIVAVVCLLVTAIAHISAGGPIGGVGVALAFTFSVLASVGLAGRTVSRVRLSVAVLFSQAVFHVLLGVGASQQSVTFAHSGMGMMTMGAQRASTVPAAGALPDSAGMWLAHALAAVLTVVALVRGEHTFWRLAEWVAYELSPRPGAVPVREPDGMRTARPRGRVLVAVVRLASTRVRRRGPPRLPALA